MLLKVFTIIILCELAACDIDQKSKKYTSKYDNINLDEVLHNKRLLDAYVKCLISKGPCTNDAAELKRTLPDALENDCARCTEKQKSGSQYVTHYLIDNEPDIWPLLEAIYDPSGNYRKEYLASKKYNETIMDEK